MSAGRLAGPAIGLAVAMLLLLLPLTLRGYGIYLMSLWAVLTIAAMGLNLTLGYAGQVSLAQGAFVGIGAYAAALLTTAGWPLALGMAVGVGLGLVVGWLLGYPALRVQHHYLAFVTLGANTLVFLVLRNEDWLTGGVYGIPAIPRPRVFGMPTDDPLVFYYFCLAMLLLVTLALGLLLRSPWGRAFEALRENPVRAESLGIDTRRYTLLAFAVGSAVGSLAGTVYAPLVQYIDPYPFALGMSLNLLLMVVVGGSGRFFGPWLGAAIAVLLPEWLRFSEGLYLIFYAVLVILVLLFLPGGLMGIAERLRGGRRSVAG